MLKKNSHSKAEAQNQQRGSALVETALTVALLSVIAIGAMQGVGQKVSQTFNDANESMAGACYGGGLDGSDCDPNRSGNGL